MYETKKIREFKDLGYAEGVLESPEAALREVMQRFQEQLLLTDASCSSEHLGLLAKRREHLHVAIDASLDHIEMIGNETGEGRILKPGEKFVEHQGRYVAGTFTGLEEADDR